MTRFWVQRFESLGFAFGYDPTGRLRLRPHTLGSAPLPAKKTAGQIEKETLKKRITNIEQGMMNPPADKC
jgi:hypothetical protein